MIILLRYLMISRTIFSLGVSGSYQKIWVTKIRQMGFPCIGFFKYLSSIINWDIRSTGLYQESYLSYLVSYNLLWGKFTLFKVSKF